MLLSLVEWVLLFLGLTIVILFGVVVVFFIMGFIVSHLYVSNLLDESKRCSGGEYDYIVPGVVEEDKS